MQFTFYLINVSYSTQLFFPNHHFAMTHLLFIFSFFCKWCMKEYNAESIQFRFRISMLVSDRTQLAQVTVFGSCLDQFFGSSATFFAR